MTAESSAINSTLPRGSSSMGLLHKQLDSSQGCLPSRDTEHVSWLAKHIFLEWSLRPDVANPSSSSGGTPQVDLFATKTIRKCHQCCSGDVSVGSSLTDAFLLSWKNPLLYTFPSIPLLPRVLSKVKQDHAHHILIALAWPCQHWYSTLLTLLIEPPLSVPLDSDVISQDHGHLLYSSLWSLHLTAWMLNG